MALPHYVFLNTSSPVPLLRSYVRERPTKQLLFCLCGIDVKFKNKEDVFPAYKDTLIDKKYQLFPQRLHLGGILKADTM